jgi:hypothetical protein
LEVALNTITVSLHPTISNFPAISGLPDLARTINVSETEGELEMDNPEKLATLGTQDYMLFDKII